MGELTELEVQIIETKQLRKDLDVIVQRIKELKQSRPTSITKTKLDEAIMWLGQNLKELGEANPYPNSRDTSNTTVEPTADGLKF